MTNEIIESWNNIPANGNILGQTINKNDVVNLYGTNVRAMHFRRHKVPGGATDRDFIYYMLSCDPAGLAWYHVSKQESTLQIEQPVPTPGFIEKLLNSFAAIWE